MDVHRPSPFLSFMMLLLLLFLPCIEGIAGTEEYVIGRGEHRWAESGVFETIDTASVSERLAPRRVGPDENLAFWVIERGGTLLSTWRSPDLEWWSWYDPYPWLGLVDDEVRWNISAYPWLWIVDGSMESKDIRRFNTSLYMLTGTVDIEEPASGTAFIDLGEIYGVNRIVLGPIYGVARIEVSGLIGDRKADMVYGHLRRVEVGINNGDPRSLEEHGWPRLRSVWNTDISVPEVTEIRFPTQPVRYVGLSIDALGLEGVEVSEVEVYGEGYVPRSTYTSQILEFPDPSNWGKIRWEGVQDPGAQVLIRTRSGKDDAPNVYWRITEDGERVSTSKSGTSLTKEEYEDLPERDQGGVTYDMANWSFWSAPYDFEEGSRGVPIVSPGPRRYFQVYVEFLNMWDRGGSLEWIGFEYSSPVPARQVVGEIWPLEVEPAVSTTFVYALKASIDEEHTGFDSVRIRTPIRGAKVRSVQLEGDEIPFLVEEEEELPGFLVRFSDHPVDITRDEGELDIVFTSEVLRYGTPFDAWVVDSRQEQIPQSVVPGNASDALSGNDLFVRTVLRHHLITHMRARPDPFTPNGDGINDETSISYDLLQLTVPVSVKVEIYALSGQYVREVYSGVERSGKYSHPWDGKDDRGKVVPPGIYVYRIRIDADTGKETRMGTVSVVY